ncbi:MAG: MFS transporter [Thermoplasmata archaeon]|nr:MFS transporter [Thermoplasmata archaeon]
MFSVVPRRVKWIIYFSSFSTVGFGYLFIVISSYLLEVGLTPGDVGILLGLSGATFVASAIPLGMLADKRGRKPLFLLGLSIVPPSLIVFAFTNDMLYLSIASVVGGIGESMFMASWNAMIADQTTVEQRNPAFALSFVVGNVFFALGFALPVFFPPIEAWTGLDTETVHRLAIVATSLLAVVAPIAEWRILKDYKEELHPKPMSLRSTSTRNLLKFSGFNGLIGLGAGFIIPLIPTWLLLKFSVDDALSGPLLAVSNITIGLAAIPSAFLARRYGMINAVAVVTSVSTVFMFSLAFVPNAGLAAMLYLVRAALMNMSVPIMDSFLMGIVAKEERGVASAINSIFWRLPNSVSTIIGGAILAAGIYDLPFYLATGFYVVGIALLYVFFRNVKPST